MHAAAAPHGHEDKPARNPRRLHVHNHRDLMPHLWPEVTTLPILKLMLNKKQLQQPAAGILQGAEQIMPGARAQLNFGLVISGGDWRSLHSTYMPLGDPELCRA